MTRREVVVVPNEFHLDEGHFLTLFLNMLSYHQICLCGNLFDTNETPTETGTKVSYYSPIKTNKPLCRNSFIYLQKWLLLNFTIFIIHQ